MRPDIPWNLAGVPPEVREAARSAARREGLPVREWLTKQILRDAAGPSEGRPVMRNLGNVALAHEEEMAGPQRHEDMAGRLKDEAADATTAFARVEEQLRALARSLETAERGQFENQRAMNKAAADMNVAAREQARAFAQLGTSVASLTKRLERIERQGAGDAIKDVLRALHLGLTRVAEKAAQNEVQSRSQIAELTARLESEAEKTDRRRHEAESTSRAIDERYARLDARVRTVETSKPDLSELTHTLERRLAEFDERLRAIEAAVSRQDAELERAFAALGGVGRLEQELARLEQKLAEPHRPDATIEPATAMPAAKDVIADLAEPPTVAEPPQGAVPPAADAPLEISTHPDHPETVESPVQAEHEDVLLLDQVAEASEVAREKPDAGDGISIVLPLELQTEDGPEEARPDPAFAESPRAEAFLASVRRSAQTAAAEAEAEQGSRGLGGFAWSVRSETSERPQTRYGLIGLAVLVLVLLIVAVILFSERPNLMGVRVFGPASNAAHLARGPRASPAATSQAARRAGQNASPHMKIGSPVLDVMPAAGGQKRATTQSSSEAAKTEQSGSLGRLDRLSALANEGNPKAEMIVGLKYIDGDGVGVDESQAAKWLERAAESGEAVAQYRLGTLYERGRGVPADPALALHWYQLAANAGNRKAMHNLAVAYAQGSGTPKDFAEAARWFSKAANLGLADSQFNLAVLYERGLGVPQSLLDAYKWYAIAAASGDTESKARLDVLSTQLGADAREAAQHAADQFKPAAFDPAVNVPPQMSDIVR
jgi:localization factor PodJL